MNWRRFLRIVLTGSLLVGAAAASAQVAWVQLILDASGSMYNTLPDGRYRITAAKDVLADLVAGLPQDADWNVGLRVYGSELQAGHADACTDSRLFVPMAGVDKPALLGTVDSVLARGATPIAWSLEQAGNDFGQPGQYLVVLVTDGEESCGGDIAQVLSDLAARGIDIDLRIIGIDLADRARQAFEGVGTFENAISAEELAAALGRALAPAVAIPADLTYPVTVNLTRDGTSATDGTVVRFVSAVLDEISALGSTGPGQHEGSLAAGSYRVEIEDAHSTGPLIINGLVVTAEGPNVFSYELAASHEVALGVSGLPALIGHQVEISWTGAVPGGSHFLTVVPVAAPEHVYLTGVWVRGESGSENVQVLGEPGLYEARYLLQLPDGSQQLAGRSEPFQSELPSTSLEAPVEVAAGSTFPVSWSAPGGADEYIAIVAVGAPADDFGVYRWLEEGNPLTMRAPDVPGEYELRYMNSVTPELVLHSRPLTVTAVAFALTAPASVAAGSQFDVQWHGPDGPGDYISLSPAGADMYLALQYEYTASGNPVSLLAHGTPGLYELRYSSDEAGHEILFSVPLEITALDITLLAPDSVMAGSSFSVEWTGPDGEYDYITIVHADASDGMYLDYAYASGGSPVQLTAPDETGAFEIRYASDTKPGTFARRAIQVR